MTKYYISADIEGIAGVVNRAQSGPGQRDYEQARRWMTNEVVAAANAARECGIDEVIVADSHAGGDNILIDELPDFVEIVRSWPRELMMVQGIECGPFVGAGFIGYHAGSRDVSGVLSHTFTGDIVELKLNGAIQSETTFNAAVAGHFGVPVIMVSGDDVYTAHAQEALGDIEVATVKTAHGMFSAHTKTPANACALVAEKTRAALARAGDFKPTVIKGPVEIEVQSSSRYKVELLSYAPGVERLSSHRIRLKVPDMVAASRFMCLYIYTNSNP